MVYNFRAAASGFAFTLCNYAATVGVVLSNDPDAHIDRIGEMLCEIELGGCKIEAICKRSKEKGLSEIEKP